jgi:NDP-sugar pyrophosphorylase family protein
VTAAILAGGFGVRLRPAVADRPKVLAPVAGRPFVAHLLAQLEAAGVRDVVLCTGYGGDQVHAALGERHGAVTLRYSREPAPLGTGGALRLAAPLIAGPTALVLNGDSFCDVELRDAWAAHCAHGAEGTLVLTDVPDPSRYGRVEVDPSGAVRGFHEKDGARGPGLINAGVYLLARDLLRAIPSSAPCSFEREVLPAWCDGRLRGYVTRGRFVDIGTPESYASATTLLAEEG